MEQLKKENDASPHGWNDRAVLIFLIIYNESRCSTYPRSLGRTCTVELPNEVRTAEVEEWLRNEFEAFQKAGWDSERR